MANESTGRNVVIDGRIVWTSGDLFQGQIKNVFGTKTPMVDDQGKPVREYGFGLAVEKAKLGQPGDIWAAIHEEAYQVYPTRQLPPGFAMKVKDGDGPDHNGQPMSNRPGHKGCMIFTLTTRIQIKFFRYNPATGNNEMINEGIKCGDYVRVQVQVKAHGPSGGQGKPGMYLNPMAVQLSGIGEAIINMPSGDDIFGTQAPPTPAGAQAVPQGLQVAQPPSGVFAPPPVAAYPGYAQPAALPQAPMAPPMGQPGFALPAAPAPMPQPHYGVLPQAHQPQPVAPMPPAHPSFGAPPAMPGYPQQAPAHPSFGGFPPPPGV